jgi:hypothetical protein
MLSESSLKFVQLHNAKSIYQFRYIVNSTPCGPLVHSLICLRAAMNDPVVPDACNAG